MPCGGNVRKLFRWFKTSFPGCEHRASFGDSAHPRPRFPGYPDPTDKIPALIRREAAPLRPGLRRRGKRLIKIHRHDRVAARTTLPGGKLRTRHLDPTRMRLLLLGRCDPTDEIPPRDRRQRFPLLPGFGRSRKCFTKIGRYIFEGAFGHVNIRHRFIRLTMNLHLGLGKNASWLMSTNFSRRHPQREIDLWKAKHTTCVMCLAGFHVVEDVETSIRRQAEYVHLPRLTGADSVY